MATERLVMAEDCQSEGCGEGIHNGHGHGRGDEVPVACVDGVGDLVPQIHSTPDVEDNERYDGEEPGDDGTAISILVNQRACRCKELHALL